VEETMRYMIAFIAASIVVLVNSLAFAQSVPVNTFYTFHGTLCSAKGADAIDRLEHNRHGVTNVDRTDAATVSCGGHHFSHSGQQTINNFGVNVFDRSPTQQVCCTGSVNDINGTGENSTVCTSPGGTSENVLSLRFNIPLIRGRLPHIECTIPAAIPGGPFSGFSAVAGWFYNSTTN
jgi:hypothetical protein